MLKESCPIMLRVDVDSDGGDLVAGLCIIDDFLELVDGVSELTGGVDRCSDAALGGNDVSISAFMLRVEIGGDGGDLLEKLLFGGVDHGLGGGFEYSSSVIDLTFQNFFKLNA